MVDVTFQTIDNSILMGSNSLPIRLYTSFFIHPNKERRAEYEECIIGNMFLEQHVFVDTDEAEKWVRNRVPSAHIHRTPSFPTFYTLFTAGENGFINIVANADILFDKTIYRLQSVKMDNVFLAISRWENMGDLYLPRAEKGSQDVWVWNGVLNVPKCLDFHMGTPGCDNRIAAEVKSLGYTVGNIVLDIVLRHKHNTNIRSYPKESVPPPYLTIAINHIQMTLPDSVPRLVTRVVPKRAILHVGYPMIDLQHEFKKHCGSYAFIHRDAPDLNTTILRALYGLRPDFVFIQAQAPGILSIETVKTIQKHSYVVNWTGDARRPIPEWYKDYAPYFDLTLFSNETDVKEMKSLGYRSAFFNIGFERYTYTIFRGMKQVHDIVFMGNNYIGGFPLSSLRSDMVRTLKSTFGSLFGVYGSGWGDSVFGTESDDDEANIYRGSKMAISLSHYDLERYFSDRMLRIMGCSTLCLAKWYPGIEKDFENGIHLVVWKNIPELVSKIQYYLANPDKAFVIARGGYTHVHAHHTWETRMEELEYILRANPKLEAPQDISVMPQRPRHLITGSRMFNQTP